MRTFRLVAWVDSGTTRDSYTVAETPRKQEE